jgi:hypothetical protein
MQPRHWSALGRTARAGLGAGAFSLALLLHGQTGPGAGGGGTVNGPGGNTGPFPGGGIITGGGDGAVITIPGGGTGNNNGNATTTDARIIADTGFVVGTTSTATVVLSGQSSAGAASGDTTNASANTYWWSITGGKILSSNTTATVEFTADAPGTVSLTATLATDGTFYTATATLTVVAANAAGTMTIPASTVTGETVNASVTPATNLDRTFRWSVSGDAAIASGQGTNAITLRAGSPGVKEITCAVTLRNITTITLRSFLLVTGSGAPVELTVVHGDGSGTYSAGSAVHIFAEPPENGTVFDRWTGDIALLGNDPSAQNQPHAIATLAGSPATLTATYKNAPVWTPVTVTSFNPQRQTDGSNRATTVASTLMYFIPPDARGVVFLLHAAGGAAADWFSVPETLLLARDLVAAGYGVAALDSVNRTIGTWAAQSTLATNLDALNHTAALDQFARDGALAVTKPVFLLGTAAGGDAAAQFAQLLATAAAPRPVKGVVLYGAASTEAAALTSPVPQLFVLAPNDTTLGTAGAALARRNSQLMSGRGLASSVLTTTAEPLTAGRLRSLAVSEPDFSASDANSVWTALKTAGVIDVNSYVKSVPSQDALKAMLAARYQARAANLVTLLAIASARQPLAYATAPRVIDFLDARAAGTPAPQPARLINLSTRDKVAFVGDAVTLHFTLGGTERATLLVRAVGPSLGRFGIVDFLAAPRLELRRGSAVIAANEGWDESSGNAAPLSAAAASVGAFTLPSGSRDAALVASLEPGDYTATISGVNGTTGDVLAEIYDVSKNGTRVRFFSALGRVQEEGEVVLPGFTLQGGIARTLLLRAVGPGLADLGVSADALLGNPRLSVFGANNSAVAANDNWTQGGSATLSAVFAASGAFPLKATNGDSALVSTFAPGSFVAQAGAAPVLQGQTSSASPTGAVLVEIYEVP